MDYDITAILTGHGEGRLAVASLRSFWEAIDHATEAGLKVQPLLVLDNPDASTEQIFLKYMRKKSNVVYTEFGDQGQARNHAITLAKGHYTAFLDADDLWTTDWLSVAHAYLADKPDTHIAHPAYNYFFESQATIFCQIDQESDEFRPDLLRVANYWDALCLCPTEIYRKVPFCDREISQGWAYEDWFWNCETVGAGCIHKIVPDTVLFKRRQKMSQTMRASGNKSRIKVNPLSRYGADFYAEPPIL